MRPGNSNIECLRTSGLKLSPGLLALQLGINASSKSALDQFQGLLILRYGRVQKLLLGVQEAGLEIEQSQLGMHRDVDGWHVGGAGFCFVPIRLNGAPDASPNGDRGRQLESD